MDIKGFQGPPRLLRGPLDIAQEIYLGFTVDRDNRANILMLSAQGGMDIEAVAEDASGVDRQALSEFPGGTARFRAPAAGFRGRPG